MMQAEKKIINDKGGEKQRNKVFSSGALISSDDLIYK